MRFDPGQHGSTYAVDEIEEAVENLLAAIRRGPRHDARENLRPLWERSSPQEQIIISAVVAACRD